MNTRFVEISKEQLLKFMSWLEKESFPSEEELNKGNYLNRHTEELNQ